MKRCGLVLAILLAATAGCSKKNDVKDPVVADEQPPTAEETTPPPPAEPAELAPAPEAKKPEPPPPPKKWFARADLAPVRGSKMKPAKVAFMQEEGKGVSFTSEGWFEGLKPGKYLWVIHEKGDCGANGAKAGPPWTGSGDVQITMEAGADYKANVDHSGLSLAIDGDRSIVDHALVLHQETKGKPGKAVACGVIVKSDAPEAAHSEAAPPPPASPK